MRPYVTVHPFGTTERRMNQILSVPGMYKVPCASRPSSSVNIFIHNLQYLAILISSIFLSYFPVSSLVIDSAE